MHGVANYWQWGHNGYNGAAFSQAARNSLRFGIVGPAPYHTDLAPPPRDAIFTSHPLMLHFHLIALYGALGFEEWVGRLVPALYSFFTLVLLFFVVRRLYGAATALVAIVLYALIPLQLIYANMIDHEQGGIFWCLCLLYAHVRWYQTGRWPYLAGAAVAVTMAMQFDWPAYYVAFLIAVHAIVAGIVRRPGWLRWRPEYTYVAVFSVVVLLNFGAYFAWIASTRGSLDGMVASFRTRSVSPSGYFSTLGGRSLDLHGAVLLGLMAAWFIGLVLRAARRKAQIRDLIPFGFLYAQSIHSLVFQEAGHVHAYWTYYLGPVLAVGGAQTLTAAGRWLNQRIASLAAGSPARQVVLTAPVAVFALALLFHQTRFAWQQLRWGFRTGAASYVNPYDDQFYEILWARALAERFPRGTVHYLLHRSIRNRRIEFDWYLDSPARQTSALRFEASDLRRDRPGVLLFDLRGATDRSAVADLASRFRTLLWDRRFVAVDAGNPGGGLEAFSSRPQRPSFWWRWLVNPDRPPVRWEKDEDLDGAMRALGLAREETAGGARGRPVRWDCPPRHALAGFDVTATSIRGTTLIESLVPLCRSVSPSSSRDAAGPRVGGPGRPTPRRIACSPGESVVGIFGRSGALLDALGVVCAPRVAPGAPVRRTELIGGKGGGAFELRCPPGHVVRGFRGRSDEVVVAAGIACGAGDGS